MVAGAPIVEVRSPLGARRWVSLPFSDECGPLAGSDPVAFVTQLDRARRNAGVGSLELRADVPGGIARPRGVSHRLALEGDRETLMKNYRSSIRQGIRAAARAGVTVRLAERADGSHPPLLRPARRNTAAARCARPTASVLRALVGPARGARARLRPRRRARQDTAGRCRVLAHRFWRRLQVRRVGCSALEPPREQRALPRGDRAIGRAWLHPLRLGKPTSPTKACGDSRRVGARSRSPSATRRSARPPMRSGRGARPASPHS